MSEEVRDIIIIGGGAAGMTAAIVAGRKGLSVTVLEHTAELCKKLSVTGNGKCNYTNMYLSEECYRSGEKEFAYSIIKDFETVDFFKSLGIMPYVKKGRDFDDERAGYVYPTSESGKDFVTAMKDELIRLSVKLKTRINILSLKKKDCFIIETGEKDNPRSRYNYYAKEVIIATGGMAAPATGSDGSFTRIIKDFGHSIIKQLPALAPVYVMGGFKPLSGVRKVCKISFYKKDGENPTLVAEEYGETQFTDKGMSGIPVMQASGLIATSLNKGEKIVGYIDFFAEMTEYELEAYLKERRKLFKHKASDKFFSGMLNEKLAKYIITICIKESVTVGELSDNEIHDLTKALKGLGFEVTAVGDFESAQVTTGGVPLSELTENLESKKVPGLYFAGEVLDVDGICGGYNLTWAWASAYRAGKTVGDYEKG